ncbi:MAG: hypothetical protein RL662_1471 [Bacteroidota bacterium]|jgi:hypothetical protein
MRIYIYLLAIVNTAFFITSCGQKKDEHATRYLNDIRLLYTAGAYTQALQGIDSIQLLFPKAIDEIKQGLALKQELRRAFNQKQIIECDSLLAMYQPKVDSLKKMFTYRKDKDDVQGVFIPTSVAGDDLTSTILRAGVANDGRSPYIESVYVGNQLHNQITVGNKDKQIAHSLVVNDDGFNFRFTNLGKQYEIIKITSIHDNGLAKFIVDNANQALTVTLKGKHTLSYPLASNQKKAIVNSYYLGLYIQAHDSLLMVKDKALGLLNYVDTKMQENENKGAKK